MQLSALTNDRQEMSFNRFADSTSISDRILTLMFAMVAFIPAIRVPIVRR